MPVLAALPTAVVREALRVLGDRSPPASRSAALRSLRERFGTHGAVRSLLERAPEGSREAFVRLATDGPAPVPDLLGRGWWGHGALPPPLDWLQRRALVVVGDDALVHAVDEARESFLLLALDLPQPEEPLPGGVVEVLHVAATVIAPAGLLDRAVNVPEAGLRAVSPTVAVSERSAQEVASALRTARVPLREAVVVQAAPDEPALPTSAEEAVGPRSVRALLQRALDEGRQVRLQYFASSRGGAPTERIVDPWSFDDDLLRGYCHLRSGERTFAVDRIGRLQLLPSGLEHAQP